MGSDNTAVFEQEINLLLEKAQPLNGVVVDEVNLYEVIQQGAGGDGGVAQQVRHQMWNLLKQHPNSALVRLASDIAATIDTVTSNKDTVREGTALFTLKTFASQLLPQLALAAAERKPPSGISKPSQTPER